MRLVALLLGLALAQLPKGGEPPVWWGKAEAAEIATLNAQKAAANLAMALYGYSIHNWSIHALHTPVLRHHAVFKFLWLNDRDNPTEFVLIVPAPAPAAPSSAPALLIPAVDEGFVHDNSELDLHNVAIFNQVLAAEPGLHPAGDGDWLALAEVYLNLVGETPQILNAANLAAISPSLKLKPPARAPKPPSVERDAAGDTELAFAVLNTDAQIENWRFEFDRRPHLLAVDRTFTATGQKVVH